jgi:hypothetical protein
MMAVQYGFDTIELINTFYFSKVRHSSCWEKFKRNCSTENVSVSIIMRDGLSDLGGSLLNACQKTLNNQTN